MAKENLLQLKKISVQYGGVKALDGIDVFIDEGEIVTLMGPNGAGKSTILKVIYGLAEIKSGNILRLGKEVFPVPHEMVGMGIAYAPQGRRIFAHLTVEENLEMGGFAIKDKNKLGKRKDEAMRMFPVLGTKRKSKAGILSGGEQQMLALARGLMAHPKVLLLDEPTLGLAPKIVKEVLGKIKEINEVYKTAIMIVGHDTNAMFEIADRVYILDKGRIAAGGFSQNILESNILGSISLGRTV